MAGWRLPRPTLAACKNMHKLQLYLHVDAHKACSAPGPSPRACLGLAGAQHQQQQEQSASPLPKALRV